MNDQITNDEQFYDSISITMEPTFRYRDVCHEYIELKIAAIGCVDS